MEPEFKNSVMNQFCKMNGIKREFCIARTPQQNGVAKRKNRTLIEAAKTMLVDSKLPTTFWAEAVNTACYVLNRVSVIKPHTKTPYELIRGRTPLIDFMKPFGFVAGNQTNGIAGTRDNIVAGQAEKKIEPEQEYILIPFCTTDPLISQGPKDSEEDVSMKPTEVNESGASDKGEEDEQDTRSEFERLLQQEKQTNSTNSFNTVGTPVSAAGPSFTNDDPSSPVNAAEASNAFEDHLFERFSPFKNAFALPHVPNVFSIDDTRIFGNAYDDEDVGAEADLNNLETTMNVSLIPTTRIDKDHPKDQIIGDLNSAIQTRRMTKISDEHAMVSYINMQRRTNHKDYQNCLFACFLSQKEPKKVIQALADPSWVEAMQEELLQFKLQKVWTLVDLPNAEGKFDHMEKALYVYIKAPRAGYKTLSTYLIENGFRRGTIDKTLFIKKEKGDILLVQVHVDDIIFESTKKSLCDEFEGLMHKRFQMSSMGELTFFLGLQVQQEEDGIVISQDKYVAKILKKFDFATVKIATTPIETNKALVKDEEAEAVPNSPFDLEAFSDSDYTAASLDRKSTTGGCEFLGKRLISWQCKKQTIVANSTTEAEYVAAANCCGQVLWIQNQMLDYGFNFMNTKIYIDNESTICIVKNPVFHSKTKHIKIRHHFIKDCYEKKLIQCTAKFVGVRLMRFEVKTGSCKVNTARQKISTARQKLVLLSQNGTVYKEWEDRMERVATTASSLDAEQNSDAQTRFETTFKKSNDPSLSRGYTLGTGEDNIKLLELMELCIKFSDLEIINLKLRVKKLEKKAGFKTYNFKILYKIGVTRRVESLDDESLGAQEDASKQGRSRIEAIDRDTEVTLVETQRRNDENDDNLMFDTSVFDDDEIVVETKESVINVATTTKSIPSAKPKEKDVVQESSENVSTATTMVSTATTTVVATPAITTPPQQRAKGIAFREPVESTVTTTVPSQKSKDKGKAIMIEPEKPLKKKDQIELDEELAREIEAEEQAELERN
ncbi:putative ribonuclease H-like domain-containing protein [Tanacetum coccineum]